METRCVYCEVEAEFVQIVEISAIVRQCGPSDTIEGKARREMNAVVSRMAQTVHCVLLFAYVVIRC